MQAMEWIGHVLGEDFSEYAPVEAIDEFERSVMLLQAWRDSP